MEIAGQLLQYRSRFAAPARPPDDPECKRIAPGQLTGLLRLGDRRIILAPRVIQVRQEGAVKRRERIEIQQQSLVPQPRVSRERMEVLAQVRRSMENRVMSPDSCHVGASGRLPSLPESAASQRIPAAHP